jgi:hypothetical protein
VIQAFAARRKTLFSYFERHCSEQKYCVSPFALIGSDNSSAKCIPQTGSLTSRLPRTAGSSAVAEDPPGAAGWLVPLNNRPTSLITQDAINTQNTNLIRRPKKPITIAALVCAFSSCELKSTPSLIRRGEPSVCKHKSTRQTKLCDFNRLRGRMGTPEETSRLVEFN